MKTDSTEAIKDALSRALENLDPDLIRDSAKILTFETVSGGNEEQERKYREQIPACLNWLESLAREHGFHFHNFDNESAEIEWKIDAGNGIRRPVFGIASHIDVVTPAGQWSHPPFAAEIENGILYGRGTQDDKGPLIQSLYGMIAAKQAGIVPPCDVRIIIGTREETGDWSDIRDYLEKRGAPDYCFTPDADFPLITGEKGMMNLRVKAQWEKSPPHEETQMEFLSLKGGQRSNIVPPLCEVLLRFPVEARHDVMKELVRETTRFTLENEGANLTLAPNNEEASAEKGHYEALLSFVGKAAHSSTPHNGYNAVVDALRFFGDIETIPPATRAYIQFLALVSSESDGRNLGIESSHDFVGDTTCVVSLIEIGPEGGWANLNIRPTMGMRCEDVHRRALAAAQSFTEAAGLAIDIEYSGKHVDALYLDPDQPGVDGFLRSLSTAFELATGKKGEFRSIGGTTYAKAFPNCCAFGPVLTGIDKELAHQADEHMALDSIRRNALVYGLSIALMGARG